jgi:plastocyanin
MSLPRIVRLLFIAALALLGVAPSLALGQAATPTAGATGTIVASALTNPRGMTWGADGTLFVALAGSGGTSPATENAPTTQAIGPFMGGPTGAVASIDATGCPVAVATGLPSTADGIGSVLGADDVAILGDQLYAAVDGGGPVHGNADAPSGVYRLNADGSSTLVADLSAWRRANPVANPPADLDPDAAGYTVVADPTSNLLWVGDPNSGQVLSVTPDGAITSIADLSAGHPVPTRYTLDPNGGIYVGTLTAAPFADGTAKVMHVAADGTVTDVWTGLTTVTGVAVGPDGTLYAIEMSTGNTTEPPFLVPGSGKLVKQTGPDSSEVVADGLMLPVALDSGPDGALYVAMPAIGANDGSGVIMRFDVSGGAPMAAEMASSACSPIPETLQSAAPATVATPTAATPTVAPAVATQPPATMAPTEAPATSTVAPATPTETPATPAATAAVTIQNFAFAPQSLEIAAGTTVTWTNTDSTTHTATADDNSWDTGDIAPGASASVTFDTPGTYTYHCSIHPSMTATVVVK